MINKVKKYDINLKQKNTLKRKRKITPKRKRTIKKKQFGGFRFNFSDMIMRDDIDMAYRKIRKNDIDRLYKGKKSNNKPVNIKKLLNKLNNEDLNIDREHVIKILALFTEFFIIHPSYEQREIVYFEDLYEFYNGCHMIAEYLNTLAKERETLMKKKNIKMTTNNRNTSESNKYLYVICPGDSPAKIVLFIKSLNLCPKCEFIQFSLSGATEHFINYNEKKQEEIVNYVKSKLPNYDKKIVIMDFFSSSYGMTAITRAMKEKYDMVGNPDIKTLKNGPSSSNVDNNVSNYQFNLINNFNNKSNNNSNNNIEVQVNTEIPGEIIYKRYPKHRNHLGLVMHMKYYTSEIINHAATSVKLRKDSRTKRYEAYRDPICKDPNYKKSKYVIQIVDFFGTITGKKYIYSYLKYMLNSELIGPPPGSRCINKMEANLSITKNDDYNCHFFVYAAILYGKCKQANLINPT
tara:strand:+ start:4079 stop:5464 length:1386 start_codon:yes stop_codon:yes gene_type:complete